MIEFQSIYHVIIQVVPLYFALFLGYGSVRWWNIFTSDQSTAVNRLVCYFTLPLFTFQFTANVDPFNMNLRFIAADAISKLFLLLILALWAKWSSKGTYSWFITSYSLSTLTSSLVVGVPLLKSMYGQLGVDLVVQGSAVQAIVWLTLLLLVLELRRSFSGKSICPEPVDITSKDLEENENVAMGGRTSSFGNLMKVVGKKLAMNPNSYACLLGIAWAFIASKWNLEMPTIVEGSVQIMAKAGTGTAMFNMGIFMASQKELFACGPSLTALGMFLRFLAGPAAMAVGSILVGLHGDILRIAIIQAALPQSITSFVYAKEYNLHADVLSTAVIFGMLVFLPLLIGYYVILSYIQ